MEVEFGSEMNEHPAKANRRPVHEHEFSRHENGALLLERLVDTEGLPPAILGRAHPIRDGPHPVFQERSINETRPDVKDVDELLVEALETPSLIGMDDERLIGPLKAPVEIDDAAHEA